MKKIICSTCKGEINPNAGYYNRLSGIQCVKCNEQLKETANKKIFAKKVECRKAIDFLLKDKLNKKYSNEVLSMHLTRDIEEIIYKYAKFYNENNK